MLYPMLSAVKLVGTDLVQAVPLVLAAAISNIVVNGLDMSIVIPLIVGSVPGSIIGSRVAPRVPQSVIRRGIVVVLTMSGLALLDKAGWAPLGSGEDQTHPVLIFVIGIALIAAVSLVWALLRRKEGLPMFGNPTVAEIESSMHRDTGRPASRTKSRPKSRPENRSREPARERAGERAGTRGPHRGALSRLPGRARPPHVRLVKRLTSVW